MRVLQIDIAGSKESGRTTLATNLVPLLQAHGFRPYVLDVHEVKYQLFGDTAGLPDSEESLRQQRATLNAMFRVAAPAILALGGTPILTPTHSSRQSFDAAVRCAEKAGVALKFILLETPNIGEAARRASLHVGDHSDMHDFDIPEVRESFIRNAARMAEAYGNINDPRVYQLAQGDPNAMATEAMRFILA